MKLSLKKVVKGATKVAKQVAKVAAKAAPIVAVVAGAGIVGAGVAAAAGMVKKADDAKQAAAALKSAGDATGIHADLFKANNTSQGAVSPGPEQAAVASAQQAAAADQRDDRNFIDRFFDMIFGKRKAV